MRLIVSAVLLVLATACSESDQSETSKPQEGSDPSVDGGVRGDGGSGGDDPELDGGIVAADAAVDAPPMNLTPCQEAAFHSDFAWLQANVLTPSCAGGSCHDADAPRASLDLSAGRAYAELVNVKSTIHTSWSLVVPGNSPASLLMVRLGGEPGPAVDIMPKGKAPLCQPMIEAFRRWIVAGAHHH